MDYIFTITSLVYSFHNDTARGASRDHTAVVIQCLYHMITTQQLQYLTWHLKIQKNIKSVCTHSFIKP